MRTTLNFDEILYIILTGITARQGLGFNRAALFFVDYTLKKFRGIMGIGPAVAPSCRLDADGLGSFHPFLYADLVTVESGLASNYGEFAIIKTTID